ncbi:MAG: hypothetical protein J3K34DRAFT_456447 [Monoraphidium minutum]|nr:MAG: hypothetical protein J3K34DRAFT_456447 [Monoraphidium minutum]
MKRRAVPLRYVQDKGERQETYERRKRSLMRKAMELAVMCNSQVAIVMFDDKGGLTQFSTNPMDTVLEQYGAAVLKPHERYTPHDVLFGNVYANGFGLGSMPQPAAAQGAGTAAAQGAGTAAATQAAGSPGDSPASSSEAFQAAMGAQQLLGPLGLAVDASSFPPLSPRSDGSSPGTQEQEAAGAPTPQQVAPGLPPILMLHQQLSGSPPAQLGSPTGSGAAAAQAALNAALPRPGAPVGMPPTGRRVMLQPSVARKPKLRVVTLSGGGAHLSAPSSAAAVSPPEASATPESYAAAAGGSGGGAAGGAAGALLAAAAEAALEVGAAAGDAPPPAAMEVDDGAAAASCGGGAATEAVADAPAGPDGVQA